MRRVGATAVVLLVSVVASSTAQVAARSRDYLFITNATDARALWVNPAGLGVLPEASVMAELTVERMGGDFRVEQYVLGFNTRGISVGYHRTRFGDEPAVGQLRVGAALPIRRGAIGFTVSRFQQDTTSSRAFGAGLLFMPNPTFQFGLTTRNIGRPEVRGVNLPITVLGGAQFTSARFQVAAEAHAAERRGIGESGFDFTYRAGAQAYLPLSFPVVVIGALNLGTNFRIDQLHLGASIGGVRQVTLMTSAVPRDDAPVFERFSAGLVARNLLVGQ
jgi:hypothetical protein